MAPSMAFMLSKRLMVPEVVAVHSDLAAANAVESASGVWVKSQVCWALALIMPTRANSVINVFFMAYLVMSFTILLPLFMM